MTVTLTIDEMREAVTDWLASRQLKATEVMFVDEDGDGLNVQAKVNVEAAKPAAG